MRNGFHNHRFCFLLAGVLLLLAAPFAGAQTFKNVLIDDDGHPTEPSIAINPRNTNEIVAGANGDRAYHSRDGGETWTKQRLSSPWGVFGDPSIVSDFTGRFYFFHLAKWDLPHGEMDRIVCERSEDGGISWPAKSFAGLNRPKVQDKPWAASDTAGNSAYRGNLYLTWTEFDDHENDDPGCHSRIRFSKSSDHGANWSSPQTISALTGNCEDSSGTTEGAVPAIGPHGEIYVSWGLNNMIYFNRSLDGGATWLSKEIAAATQPRGWDFPIPGILRVNGMPVTATDVSQGPGRGTIFINWSDQRNGVTDTDVWVAKSTDGGTTWSAPVRVNDDRPGHQQFSSWMSVDPVSGVVYVVFYDRRAYNTDSFMTDVYLAYSLDHGRSFKNIKISDSPFVPSSKVFFGDYTNVSAFGGRVRPIWTRMDNGKTSVWTALVDL